MSTLPNYRCPRWKLVSYWRSRRSVYTCYDVAEAGTPLKVTQGLVDEFGTDRVVDAPISEPGFSGIRVGAALTGMRPVVDIGVYEYPGLYKIKIYLPLPIK